MRQWPHFLRPYAVKDTPAGVRTKEDKGQDTTMPLGYRVENIVVMPIMHRGKTSNCHSSFLARYVGNALYEMHKDQTAGTFEKLSCRVEVEAKKTKQDMNLPKEIPVFIIMHNSGPT